jgi:hypothetical protein
MRHKPFAAAASIRAAWRRAKVGCMQTMSKREGGGEEEVEQEEEVVEEEAEAAELGAYMMLLYSTIACDGGGLCGEVYLPNCHKILQREEHEMRTRHHWQEENGAAAACFERRRRGRLARHCRGTRMRALVMGSRVARVSEGEGEGEGGAEREGGGGGGGGGACAEPEVRCRNGMEDTAEEEDATACCAQRDCRLVTRHMNMCRHGHNSAQIIES